VTRTNPYRFGSPAKEVGDFFGRAAALQEAMMLLGTRWPNGHLEVWGPKRSGKTSLLHRIRAAFTEASPDLVCVYLDSKSCDGTHVGFAQSVCQALARQAKAGAEMSQENPWTEFDNRLRALTEAGKRVVLFLDEFQALVIKYHLEVTQFSRLRASTQQHDISLMLIVATSRLLRSFGGDMMDSGLPNIFTTLPVLDPLDERAALAMVDAPARLAGLDFPPGTSDWIYKLCHGHPFLTARCAYELASRVIRGETIDLTASSLFDDMYRLMRENLADLGDSLPGHADQIRFLATNSFQRSFPNNDLPPYFMALRDSGLCIVEQDDSTSSKLRPTGALCARFLDTTFGGRPDDPRSPPNEIAEFNTLLKGIEPRLRRLVMHRMGGPGSSNWLKDEIVRPELREKAKRLAKGEHLIEGLSFGELFELMRRMGGHDDQLLSDLKAIEESKVVTYRNADAHSHSTQPRQSELRKAIAALYRLKDYLDAQHIY
jgi:AAA domain